MQNFFFILLVICMPCLGVHSSTGASIPIVINTWAFTNATKQAWTLLSRNGVSAVDSIVAGCSVCEREQCDGTVGFGGSPDEHGETTLDAMIMDGLTMNIGAVGALRNVKDAIAVARHVMDNTKHTLLVGSQATEFAVSMGFEETNLQTDKSRTMWQDWRASKCQPNFWMNVMPHSDRSCGPYAPVLVDQSTNRLWYEYEKFDESGFGADNHDTIGMIAVDRYGNIAAGTSTNGARNKIPGRVGDSPIPGAGAYAENGIGAAAATGDGDVMMRFLPSAIAVEGLRQGKTPHQAGEEAMRRIAKYYPTFVGGIIVLTKNGDYAAACHGMDEFPYSVADQSTNLVEVKRVACVK